jgi:SRSO17 transposase
MRDYCLGAVDADRPQERRAAGGGDGAVASCREASILASFCRQRTVVGWAMLAKASELVLPAIESRGSVDAWIIDDTGFPKKGQHSVG